MTRKILKKITGDSSQTLAEQTTLPTKPRYRSSRILAFMTALTLALGVAQLSLGQNLIGTFHTTRPGGLDFLNGDLELTLTLRGQSLAASTYTAAATPAFSTGPNNTFSNPAFFPTGNYLKVVSQFDNSTATPGNPVTVDLRGSLKKSIFGSGLPLASKTISGRWYEEINSVEFPGAITGTSLAGAGGWRWIYVNGEWVEVSPGGGGPVDELMVSFGMAKEPGSEPGEQQLMVANGYRLDAVAQTAIANHYGETDIAIDMVRELGSGITDMGFPGEISYQEFGSQLVDAGSSFEAEFGEAPSDPAELILLQVFATFDSPRADQLADTVEYWVAYTGADVTVPEPKTVVLALLAMLLQGEGIIRRRLS